MSRISPSDPVQNPRVAVPGEADDKNASTAEAPKPAGAAANGDMQSSVDRVEAMMDNVGKRVGDFTSKAGQGLYRFLARTRESLEDFWAEAQSIRHGDKDEPPPPAK